MAAGIQQLRLDHAESPVAGTEEALSRSFLLLGECLAQFYTDTFARGLSSIQGPDELATDLRQRVAQELHRRAAAIVTAGGRVIVATRLVQGEQDSQAVSFAADQLGSILEEDQMVPGETADELLTIALRDYALAAGALNRLDHREIDEFIGTILAIANGTLVAASMARADESAAA